MSIPITGYVNATPERVQFLRDLLVALDALPEKKLIRGAFKRDGCFCAVGAYANHKAAERSERFFKLYPALADSRSYFYSEVVKEHIKDLGIYNHVIDLNNGPEAETDEDRFTRVRGWVEETLKVTVTP